MVEAAPTGSILCGEGAWHAADRLRELAPDTRIIALEPPTRSLAVCWRRWVMRRWSSGGVPDRQTLEPNYLRPPSITMPAGRPSKT